MPTNEITTWLDFTLQQMAAESYLDGIANLDDRNLIRDQLLLGNNHPFLDPDVRGATRFPDSLATRFLDTYRIVSHHANDSTGFSATLIQERGTNNFTLSFRSTEYRDQSEGGGKGSGVFLCRDHVEFSRRSRRPPICLAGGGRAFMS
jgi:hypothetical protein